MIICLQFERKSGYPSCDLFILNEWLMQTGAARYIDVDRTAGDGRLCTRYWVIRMVLTSRCRLDRDINRHGLSKSSDVWADSKPRQHQKRLQNDESVAVL